MRSPRARDVIFVALACAWLLGGSGRAAAQPHESDEFDRAGVEYRFVGDALILWDAHAEIVIDALPGVFVGS